VVERIGVTDVDLRRLLNLVDPARCGESGEFVPDSLLRDLPDALGCDEASFQVCDPYLRQWGAVQALAPDETDSNSATEGLAIYWAAFWEAFCYPQLSGDFVNVRRTACRAWGRVRGGPRFMSSRAADR
jgi:hypothetical protein